MTPAVGQRQRGVQERGHRARSGPLRELHGGLHATAPPSSASGRVIRRACGDAGEVTRAWGAAARRRCPVRRTLQQGPICRAPTPRRPPFHALPAPATHARATLRRPAAAHAGHPRWQAEAGGPHKKGGGRTRSMFLTLGRERGGEGWGKAAPAPAPPPRCPRAQGRASGVLAREGARGERAGGTRLRQLLRRAVPKLDRALQVLGRLRVQLLAQQDRAQLEAVLARRVARADALAQHLGRLLQLAPHEHLRGVAPSVTARASRRVRAARRARTRARARAPSTPSASSRRGTTRPPTARPPPAPTPPTTCPPRVTPGSPLVQISVTLLHWRRSCSRRTKA